MQLNPEQLPVGSIVNRNGTPYAIQAKDITGCVTDNEMFNSVYRPIPLTEKILTEWCGFEKETNESVDCFINGNILIRIFKDRFNLIAPNSNVNLTETPPLHQLQLLYLALTQTPLPIQIK